MIHALALLHNWMRSHPLSTFCLFGLLGILPDLDHLLEQTRFLHPCFTVVAGGLIIFGVGICLGAALILRLVGGCLNA